jgi:hypothetical protein
MTNKRLHLARGYQAFDLLSDGLATTADHAAPDGQVDIDDCWPGAPARCMVRWSRSRRECIDAGL